MPVSVTMPRLGESVTEGTVTRWLKHEGDQVEVDEPLLEVSTDKVDTEIPSPIAGVIEEILVQEDETVEVGTALVTIGDGAGQPAEEAAPAADAAPPAAAPAAAAPAAAAPAAEQAEQEPLPAAPQPAAAPTQASAQEPTTPSTEATAEATSQAPAPAVAAPVPAAQPASEPVPAAAAPAQAEERPVAAQPAEEQPSRGSHAGSGYVTPIVRKLANQQGIDLATVTGTGVGGRIRKQDILNQAGSAEPAAPAAPARVEVSPLRGTTQP